MGDDRLGNSARGWVLPLSASLVLAFSAGCGFRLRGEVTLPPEMSRTYVQGGPSSELVRQLRARLTASGADVVGEIERAGAVLVIERERWGRRVLSVGRDAKVAEYELSYSVSFSVRQREAGLLVPSQQVVLVRDYRFDPNNVLGKSDEASLLRDEMRRDMVTTMLRRIEYARRTGNSHTAESPSREAGPTRTRP